MDRRNPIPLVEPMLAVRSEPFDNPEFLFEVKWDGYRALAYLDSGGTELRSRNRQDITGSFPELGGLHLSVKHLPALLDGEVVVFSGGRPSFGSLQARGRLSDPLKIKRAAVRTPALYLAFDILYVSGRPVIGEPLKRRKEILAASVQGGAFLVVADFVTGSGILFARAARDRGLEGVMAKALNSPYLPGKRSHYWKKIRFTNGVDLAVCGYRPGKGGRKLGALLLCGFRNGDLVYCGKVGTGFSREAEDDLIRRLQPLRTGRPPAAVSRQEAGGVIWVRPHLVCAVEYLEKTAGGFLRHPIFKGLRLDKGLEECEAP
ncbi:MAG: non-homologous end-joining DNA ligase [Peptococcaceae bacterium]|nr:non-homologous end-joining DNA ligase [Peptococcaceae bacterium]